jgi:hypothetical protein
VIVIGSQLAFYALAGLGGVMIVVAVIHVMRRRIDVAMANQMIIKLARAANLERAVKLCAAAPGTYLDAIAAAIERSKGAPERSAAELAVHAAFDEVANPAAANWLRSNERGLLGVIAVAVVAGLAFSFGVLSRPLEVAAGLATLAGIWLLARRNYYASALVAVRATVLPAIIDARLGPPSDPEPAPPSLPSPTTRSGAIVAQPPQSLLTGTCPLCKHTVIKTVQRDDPRFRTLVCASCGYAQEFANLDALP